MLLIFFPLTVPATAALSPSWCTPVSYTHLGTYARMSDEPDFQYLGGGAVTFKLETEDGIIYNYTITISIDGSNVNFKAEDDLPK